MKISTKPKKTMKKMSKRQEKKSPSKSPGLTGPTRLPRSNIRYRIPPKPETREAKPESPAARPAHTIIEKIIERIVERPLRRRLPDTRHAVTHKFDIAGHEGYITAGLYEDGQPGEVFITMAKEGSTIGGLMDAIATLVSVSLQYGVPVESLVRKFEHVRFEPSGMTSNTEIPFAKILGRLHLPLAGDGIRHGLSRGQCAQAAGEGIRSRSPGSATSEITNAESASRISRPSTAQEIAAYRPRSLTSAPSPKKNGNGHGRHIPDAFPVTRDDARAATSPSHPTAHAPTLPNLRLAIVVDPLSQQGTELQADAPACDLCGSITVRSGTCYKCLNCGNSMGCS